MTRAGFAIAALLSIGGRAGAAPPGPGPDTSLHGKAGVTCVDCHPDLEKDPKKAKPDPVDCFGCHESVAKKHPFHPQMVEKPKQVACQDCHGGHDLVATSNPAFKFNGAGQVEACGKCHEAARDDYKQSEHGKALTTGVKEAPTCITCHAAALTGLPDAQRKMNQEKLCLSCHLDNAEVRARVAPSAGFIAAYGTSVHGRALAAGNDKAPGCSDCHGSHLIKNGLDSSSQVNRSKIHESCAECHADIAKKFKDSVHGAALAKGAADAPTCTTCHGEHDIQKHDDPRSPVAAKNVSHKVCAPCHQSVALTSKYGIKSDRFQTFESSFHGLSIKGGSVEVANCASCHGAHDIKPSSDPASHVNKKNLVATCGKCHPGANENFAVGQMHVGQSRANEPVLYWVSTIYLMFVIVVIGGMLGHNALDFLKKARRHLAVRRGEVPEAPVPHKLYVRMTGSERLQHAALLVSFIALVITGFWLRYPDAWWAAWIKSWFPRLFGWRAGAHRVAGVAMLAACVVHVGYCAFTPRGRQLIRDLFPRWKDARDAIGVMKYNLGLSKEKPKLDRFSYIEKAEYWALVWGTIVMAVTGCLMWFDNKSMSLVTKLGYDVARTIHFYEAWLATLAILVWHFYFVIFNPDAYPMNMSWITGKMSEREMEEEHPAELERLKKEEEAAAAAAALAGKPPKPVAR